MKYVMAWTSRLGGSGKENEDGVQRACNCSQSGSQLRARRSTSSSGESTAKEGSP
jgi:hypothetical protein